MKGFKSFPKKTEIPFTEGINVILGPNGSGKSARYDTKVLTNSGEIRQIGEIVEESLKKSKEIKRLDDGIYTQENPLKIEILSLNPKSMKIEPKKVSAFIKRDGEKNLYTINTKTGKKVTTTGCHPVMTYQNGKVASQIVKNLKRGNFIATPNKLKFKEQNPSLKIRGIPNKKLSNEFARFLGYIIGDGCIIKNKRIDFINKDEELIEDYTSIIKRLGFKPKTSLRKNSLARTIYFNSRLFSNGLIEFFNQNYKKEKKHIHQKILFSKKEILANFLAALFDCDASVRKDNPTFEYVTMSEQLANDVIFALLRFGIIARKTIKKKCATNTKNKIKRDYYFILIEGKEKLTRLHNNIKLKCFYKKQEIEKWANKDITPNPNIDVLPREVNKLIKECKETLNIFYKPLRKKYPFFAAYIENRCSPTREGAKKVNTLFKEKLKIYKKYSKILKLDFEILMNAINDLNLSRVSVARYIGVTRSTVTNRWNRRIFHPKIKNLNKLFEFVKKEISRRMILAEKQIKILDCLSTSDIFWDQISSIEKVKGEKYVYDLTIEDNHNFVANNIFVHNSNISDALCFVLGRLSIKSMRAAKARSLIFLGTKAVGPSKEASVEIVFDNSDRTFSVDRNEVSIKRTVRRNGQSIYKINNETKTRQQILGLLAQAGIDPNGFNIILQGEIQNFVRMYPDDRRKIIEEVSGISIYESRKEKSLRELNKTEEKLKEVSAILRERTAYLNNLEKERQQALRFKKLEKDVKILKASIISSDLNKDKKELEKINQEIANKNKEIEKIKKLIVDIRAKIENFEAKINSINKTIQESTGLEQEKLNQEIANIRAELAGLSVRYENYETKHSNLLKQKQELEEVIEETGEYIKDLKKTISKSSSSKKGLKDKEVELKKQELEKLEEQRKKFYMVKSELKSIRDRFQDKNSLLEDYENESSFLLRQMKALYGELFDKNTNEDKVESLKLLLAQKKELLDNLNKKEIELERISSANENEIDKENKLIEIISKMDICPVCKSKITEVHVHEINKETLPKLNNLKAEIEKSDKELGNIYSKRDLLKQDIDQLTFEISRRESDLMKLSNINDKKQQIKEMQERIQKTKQEFEELDKIKKKLERTFEENQNIEQKYETARIEVQEISLRNDEDVDSEISFKQRELERSKISLKQLLREQEDLHEERSSLQKIIDEKEKILEKKKKQEEELSKKFQQLISEKDNFQKDIRNKEYELSNKQNIIYNIEQKINNFKIDKARVDAIIDNLEAELLEFNSIQVIKSKRETLVERLARTQDLLSKIGTINMRSLEVYDSVKKEYDIISDKVEIISKEKEGILKIIHEIDIKKKKVFLKTLDELNEKFSRNFAQLSTKGQVFLEVENRKDPFEEGVSIIVKTGHGKYFDVKSLSGGEQVLVALSLIFAIQELNPYCFYVLDEIDAALDKRNSERLANLLNKYMKKGQYIVITHNDEVISNATTLYGVSMHDGISKIISLKI